MDPPPPPPSRSSKPTRAICSGGGEGEGVCLTPNPKHSAFVDTASDDDLFLPLSACPSHQPKHSEPEPFLLPKSAHKGFHGYFFSNFKGLGDLSAAEFSDTFCQELLSGWLPQPPGA